MAELKIIVLEGDETGQEMLEESLRVLDPSVIGLEVALERFDTSLENRRKTDNEVVLEAADAMKEARFGLKAATVTPEGAEDVGSPNGILRERIDGKVIIRIGRRIPGVTPATDVSYPIAVCRMAVGDAYGAEQWRAEEEGSEVAYRTERITRPVCRAVAEFSFRTAQTMGDYSVERGEELAARVYGGPKWTVSPVYEGMLKEEMDGAAERYPAVPYRPVLIDATYAGLISGAADAPLVVPALNRDGDCLSDFVLPLFGSIAGAESVLLSFDEGYAVQTVMAEAPHGTAPSLLGKNTANPMAMILAAGAVLHYIGEDGNDDAETAARAINEAVFEATAGGVRTRDLGGSTSMTDFTDHVISLVRRKVEREASRGSGSASADGAASLDGRPDPEGTLAITDSRTGETYELPVVEGSVRAMDLRQIKVDEGDLGLVVYDPGLENTAVARSEVTSIDGREGRLTYRGYAIEELCERSTFLEVAYLLIYGELPSRAQLESWTEEITHHTFVHENVKKSLEGFTSTAHPMGMLLAAVGGLSTFYPEAARLDDEGERHLAAVRLLAKMPTLAAFAHRHVSGLPYVYPDNELDYPGNFLSMMFRMSEWRYEPDARLRRALEVLFILHADHEQNCSTNAVRGVGSSRVDPYSAVAAGVAALYGRLHGGASEAAMRMLDRIGSAENIPRFLERVKGGDERLSGFGHRIYEGYDPRARIIKRRVDEVFEITGVNPKLEVAVELEKQAAGDEWFTSRSLYPNVEYYSGLIYEALGMPRPMFGAVFAIPRTAGWMAQWLEMVGDRDQPIVRPRQIYAGPAEREYVSLDDR